jgi:hypothetical protein
MNTKKTVLLKAHKLIERKKSIIGGASAARHCCEYDFETGNVHSGLATDVNVHKKNQNLLYAGFL